MPGDDYRRRCRQNRYIKLAGVAGSRLRAAAHLSRLRASTTCLGRCGEAMAGAAGPRMGRRVKAQ